MGMAWRGLGREEGVEAEGRVEEGGTFNLFHTCLPGVAEAGGRDIRWISHCLHVQIALHK